MNSNNLCIVSFGAGNEKPVDVTEYVDAAAVVNSPTLAADLRFTISEVELTFQGEVVHGALVAGRTYRVRTVANDKG